MPSVPSSHEQTPIRCSECHIEYLSFVQVRPPSVNAGEYVPDRCACGHLQRASALPPGTLFGVDGDPVKRYHPRSRPN